MGRIVKMIILISFYSSMLIASVIGASGHDATADLSQVFQLALPDDVAVLCLQFAFYDREVLRVLSSDRDLIALCTRPLDTTLPDDIVAMVTDFAGPVTAETLQLSCLIPGFRAEPGVRVAGAGSQNMNGWYRRMEVDAEPPASWLRLDLRKS